MQSHYEQGNERGRLDAGAGRLEFLRTLDIITRFAPAPPAVVYDIGGGPGRYAAHLADVGYTVHLVDAVPLHVEQAQALGALASATVGDARDIDAHGHTADMALLLGPLYHLTSADDRLQALREAARIVRPGGVVIAAAISRYASLMDGYWRGLIADPAFREILEQDLSDGQHRNPADHPEYFTTAYFHQPGALQNELREVGLCDVRTLAVEGPFWLHQDLPALLDDDGLREAMLHHLRRIEAEPSLLGASAHLVAVGTTPLE